MPNYLANSEADVAALTLKLSELNPLYLASHAYDLGVMKFDNPVMRFMLWVVKKTRGFDGVQNFFLALQERAPDTIKEMFMQTITHCFTGKDTEDQDSVGGWSQREIDLLCKRLAL